MPQPKTPTQDWDNLASRAVQGLVRNNQRHLTAERRRRRLRWAIAGILGLTVAGAAYYFRDIVAVWLRPVQDRVRLEWNQITDQKSREDWPSDLPDPDLVEFTK